MTLISTVIKRLAAESLKEKVKLANPGAKNQTPKTSSFVNLAAKFYNENLFTKSLREKILLKKKHTLKIRRLKNVKKLRGRKPVIENSDG